MNFIIITIVTSRFTKKNFSQLQMLIKLFKCIKIILFIKYRAKIILIFRCYMKSIVKCLCILTLMLLKQICILGLLANVLLAKPYLKWLERFWKVGKRKSPRSLLPESMVHLRHISARMTALVIKFRCPSQNTGPEKLGPRHQGKLTKFVNKKFHLVGFLNFSGTLLKFTN